MFPSACLDVDDQDIFVLDAALGIVYLNLAVILCTRSDSSSAATSLYPMLPLLVVICAASGVVAISSQSLLHFVWMQSDI